MCVSWLSDYMAIKQNTHESRTYISLMREEFIVRVVVFFSFSLTEPRYLGAVLSSPISMFSFFRIFWPIFSGIGGKAGDKIRGADLLGVMAKQIGGFDGGQELASTSVVKLELG